MIPSKAMRATFIHFFSFILLHIPSVSPGGARSCKNLFEHQQTYDPISSLQFQTSQIISLLVLLVENRILSTQDIQNFRNNLLQNKLVNPIGNLDSNSNATKAIYRLRFQELIQTVSQPDFPQIIHVTTEWLNQIHTNNSSRENVKEVTAEKHYPIVLHRVRAGNATLKHPHRDFNIEIKKDFAAMETMVTQHHWASVMGAVPDQFNDYPDIEDVEIDGRKISMLPNHPVTYLSWWSALVFANELSKAHKLDPVYDFEGISFVQRNGISGEIIALYTDDAIKQAASVGELWGLTDARVRADEVLKRIIFLDRNTKNHQRNGFRLLTHDEQTFIRLKRGRLVRESDYLIPISMDMECYVWSKVNSRDRTQRVAQLLPFDLDGATFFDLYGNAGELCFDENPLHHITGEAHFRSIRGGSFKSIPFFQDLEHFGAVDLMQQLFDTGLRLGRTLDAK